MAYEITWLKQPRENAGMGQKALLDVVGLSDVNHIGRWELCKKPVPKKYFAILAKCFGMKEATLYANYQRDWAETHPHESGEGTDDKQQTKGDTRKLQSVLKRMESDRFLAHLLDNTQTDSLSEAVEVLANLIEQDQIASLLRTLTRMINDFCEDAILDDVASLRVLCELYRVILLTCAVPLPSLEPVGNLGAQSSNRVSGAKAAHTLIFAIDRTLNLKGHKRLEIENENAINDHRNTTLCIQFSDTGAADNAEWAHNFVAQVGKMLGLQRHCPDWNEPNNEEIFRKYCLALNDALGARNSGDRYLFARFDEPIPAPVFDYIERWLGNLYVFECKDSQASSSNITRGDTGVLGAWMAQGETAIEACIERLKGEAEAKREHNKAPAETGSNPAGSNPADQKSSQHSAGLDTATTASKKISEISKNISAAVRPWIPKWPADDS